MLNANNSHFYESFFLLLTRSVKLEIKFVVTFILFRDKDVERNCFIKLIFAFNRIDTLW